MVATHTESLYAEYHILFIVMLEVILLSVIMLNVVILMGVLFTVQNYLAISIDE